MTLLLDALERTLKEPQGAGWWHYLTTIWMQTQDQAEHRSVLDILVNLPDGDARSDILRWTFLAGVSGDARFENAAAARVLAQEPIDPDRMAAFMAYHWASALRNIEARPDFVATLSARRLPEMARRLMQHATQLLPADFSPRAPEQIQRVAVVVPYVGNQFHTPSMMAVEQCAMLLREGLQVRIFSAQELVMPAVALYRGDGGMYELPALNAQQWVNTMPAGLGMTVSDSRFGMASRLRNMMPLLASFNPDVVLLVGLYSPLAAALHAVRPVVGISVNTVPPIAPLDVWLSADAGVVRREVWGGIFPPPQPVFHPYRVKRSTKPWRVTRAEFGLNETNVVWITAGFRLQHEIKGEWASSMLQLMSRHPNVVWLLVGGDGKLPPDLQQAAPGRVQALATRNDLPGILRICDIYVNPLRMGGGISVAEAMAEGLPVTSFAGSDGGDKVGDLALADMNAYMQRLAALTENPGLRAEMGHAMQKRFTERLDIESSGPALVAACRQAANLARVRFTKPS